MSVLWRRTWWLLFAIFSLVFGPVALFSGLVSGLVASIAGLLFVLGWHLWHLARLMGWLAGDLDRALPRGLGVSGMMFLPVLQHRRVRIRRGQQQALSETLDRFVRAFQALPDGVIAFDRHRYIEWINARAEIHFALSAETDRGQALTNLIRQPDFVAYLEGGRYEEPLIYRDGRVEGITLLLQIIPMATIRTFDFAGYQPDRADRDHAQRFYCQCVA